MTSIRKMNDKGFTLVELLVVIVIIALIPTIVFGIPWILMKCWNYVLPDMFGVKTITYWKMFALWIILVIVANLFRGSHTTKKEG